MLFMRNFKYCPEMLLLFDMLSCNSIRELDLNANFKYPLIAQFSTDRVTVATGENKN